MIRYRYPGQEEWTEIDGDEYVVTPPSRTCRVYTTQVWFNVEIVDFDGTPRPSAGSYETGYVPPEIEAGSKAAISYPAGFSPVYPFSPKYVYLYPTGVPRYNGIDAGILFPDGRTATREARTSQSNWGFVPGSVKNITVVQFDQRQNRLPDECSCVFEVFKENILVKRFINPVCPEVELEKEECPEGTCEVECSDTICCYGSDGISVFSFPKS